MGQRGAGATLPSGTVTFVLGDIEGSVRLWETQPDGMAAATSRLDALVSELVEGHGGVRPEEQGEGDSFVAAFGFADRAVAFVLALQRVLHTEPWATALPLRVRAALHAGAAQLRDSANYMGPSINRCARIRSLAHGGQVLLSESVAALVADDLEDGRAVVDLGCHQLRDFDRPERVYQLAHPDLPGRFPALRDPSDSQRIPTVLTSFVEREHEMDTVDDLLRGERLVTLTGAGGSGKTRLAIEYARRRLGHLGGPVAWADAAPVADGAILASCVAGAFGVREVPAEPLIDTIVREVADRRCLLVIDNCEHVITDAARIVEALVARCSRLRVLATSREPLGVLGEAVVGVPSLDERGSVQLFVDRAQAVHSGFVLTPSCQEVVTEVCRRLDGIPLAIELAAARARVLTPQQIADGLADRFRLLTGGSRTALPRQRTLEASVDWSYRLLSQSERTVLARLSVFAGGFTLTAARSVCSDDAVPEASVLDLLTALVDKSLVLADASAGAPEARYRILETIRDFARQRLADGPDPQAVRDRHLGYFLDMAEQMAPRIEQGDEFVWLDRLEEELDNLRAALDWAHQSGKSELLLRLASALWLFHEVRCRFEEGKSWLHAALAASPERTPIRAAALYGLGDISMFTMDMEGVASAGREALEIGEHLGDQSAIARGLTVLGWAACFGTHRDSAWARETLSAAVEWPELASNPWLLCDATMALGLACTDQGDLSAAAQAFDSAMEAANRSHNLGSLQRAVYFRGWLHALTGEIEQTDSVLRRVVELAEPLDDTFFRTLSVAVAANATMLRGDWAAAVSQATEAVEMGKRYGNPFAAVLGGSVLARTLVAMGDDDQAWSVLETVRPIAADLSLSWLRAFAEGTAALAAARRGQRSAARSVLEAGATQAAGRPYAAGLMALYRGTVERLLENEDEAEAAFGEAAGALYQSGARSDTAAALEGLAVSAVRRNQHERAARLFLAADAERMRLGVTGKEWTTVLGRDAIEVDALVSAAEVGAPMSLGEAVQFALRGKGGRRRPPSGWESLTPTELEVVRLVGDGLTNPAIGERLAMSRGTVKVHLSHIFAKLDVVSRAQLAAEAARRSIG